MDFTFVGYAVEGDNNRLRSSRLPSAAGVIDSEQKIEAIEGPRFSGYAYAASFLTALGMVSEVS